MNACLAYHPQAYLSCTPQKLGTCCQLSQNALASAPRRGTPCIGWAFTVSVPHFRLALSAPLCEKANALVCSASKLRGTRVGSCRACPLHACHTQCHASIWHSTSHAPLHTLCVELQQQAHFPLHVQELPGLQGLLGVAFHHGCLASCLAFGRPYTCAEDSCWCSALFSSG